MELRSHVPRRTLRPRHALRGPPLREADVDGEVELLEARRSPSRRLHALDHLERLLRDVVASRAGVHAQEHGVHLLVRNLRPFEHLKHALHQTRDAGVVEPHRRLALARVEHGHDAALPERARGAVLGGLPVEKDADRLHPHLSRGSLAPAPPAPEPKRVEDDRREHGRELIVRGRRRRPLPQHVQSHAVVVAPRSRREQVSVRLFVRSFNLVEEFQRQLPATHTPADRHELVVRVR
mmetsp:Transcript_15264/g.50136  ORF Transcript_15264/g.50136 Transcript_15264/m.50136 type:complete len:237 (-) Transcript_15264:371-1081(-)